jgi:hypothetical protein
MPFCFFPLLLCYLFPFSKGSGLVDSGRASRAADGVVDGPKSCARLPECYHMHACSTLTGSWRVCSVALPLLEDAAVPVQQHKILLVNYVTICTW